MHNKSQMNSRQMIFLKKNFRHFFTQYFSISDNVYKCRTIILVSTFFPSKMGTKVNPRSLNTASFRKYTIWDIAHIVVITIDFFSEWIPYCMQAKAGSMLASYSSNNANLPVLYCSSLLAFSKRLFCIRKKQEAYYKFFLWVALMQAVFMYWYTSVEFYFKFGFYCGMALFCLLFKV